MTLQKYNKFLKPTNKMATFTKKMCFKTLRATYKMSQELMERHPSALNWTTLYRYMTYYSLWLENPECLSKTAMDCIGKAITGIYNDVNALYIKLC